MSTERELLDRAFRMLEDLAILYHAADEQCSYEGGVHEGYTEPEESLAAKKLAQEIKDLLGVPPT